MKQYLLVGLGGALGSMLRYLVGSAVGERFGVRFPYGTLAINVSACFLIGLTLEYLHHHTALNPAWTFLIPVGFIGAFSTFSTFEWEVWANFSGGAFWTGIAYVSISLAAGLIAVAVGNMTARAIS